MGKRKRSSEQGATTSAAPARGGTVSREMQDAAVKVEGAPNDGLERGTSRAKPHSFASDEGKQDPDFPIETSISGLQSIDHQLESTILQILSTRKPGATC